MLALSASWGRVAVIAVVAVFAVSAIHVASATAAPSFNGIVVDARLITVNTATASATVRINPIPGGSFAQPPPIDLLTWADGDPGESTSTSRDPALRIVACSAV